MYVPWVLGLRVLVSWYGGHYGYVLGTSRHHISPHASRLPPHISHFTLLLSAPVGGCLALSETLLIAEIEFRAYGPVVVHPQIFPCQNIFHNARLRKIRCSIVSRLSLVGLLTNFPFAVSLLHSPTKYYSGEPVCGTFGTYRPQLASGWLC